MEFINFTERQQLSEELYCMFNIKLLEYMIRRENFSCSFVYKMTVFEKVERYYFTIRILAVR